MAYDTLFSPSFRFFAQVVVLKSQVIRFLDFWFFLVQIYIRFLSQSLLFTHSLRYYRYKLKFIHHFVTEQSICGLPLPSSLPVLWPSTRSLLPGLSTPIPSATHTTPTMSAPTNRKAASTGLA
jgi:hypothetical protein